MTIRRSRMTQLMQIHMISLMIVFLTYISISLSGPSEIYAVIGGLILIISSGILWVTRGKIHKFYSALVSLGIGMIASLYQSADFPKDGSVVMFFLGLVLFLILLESGTALYKTTHKYAWVQLLLITYLVMAAYVLTALNDNFVLFFAVVFYITFLEYHFSSYFHHQRKTPHEYMNLYYFVPISLFVILVMLVLGRIGDINELYLNRIEPKSTPMKVSSKKD